MSNSITPRLSWTRIRELFAGEWVELVEFKWGWDRSFPVWAKVRHHAPSHPELLEQVESAPRGQDSVVLYVGSAHAFIQHEATGVAL